MPELKGYSHTIFLLFYVLTLLAVAATTPISPSEAYLFFQEGMTPTTFLMHLGDTLVSGELGLRIFFLLLGCLNAYLFYALTAYTFDKKKDRYLALYFYLMLPGVIVSTVLANDAVIIAFLTLLFLYFHFRGYSALSLVPLLLLGFVHWSALYLYLTLILYGLFQKEKWVFLHAFMATAFYFLVGTEMSGGASGNHFFEALGIYATIFSPFLFIYLFYALYRTLLRGERSLWWYISFGALSISLVLSLQERIKVTDFSAYLMLGIVVAVDTYLGSLKVRLKRFQKSYRLFFWIITFSLIASSLMMLLHQPIYRFFGKKYYPVVASVYEPYDKAMKLKTTGKKCVKESKQKVLYQMRYYGLNKCF